MKRLIISLFIVNLIVSSVDGSFKRQRPTNVQGPERTPYIVYMGELPSIEDTVEGLTTEDHHHNLLTEVIGDESIAREARIHSYGRSFNGFAAKLLPHEASKLKEKSNVVSVFPNKVNQLLTTRSWDFLGMREDSTPRNLRVESDTIIGLIDSGIYVDAPSFNDEGFGPPPLNWKGKCDKGLNFTGCNRKVIGARNCIQYPEDDPDETDKTPADFEGHGTHTASTAAGRAVKGASLYGVGKGTARGGVPSARIAMYRACNGGACADINVLVGFDEAIADGVDILSVSVGSSLVREFWEDPIAIGSYHAMNKGILTVAAAGNDGPAQATVSNYAPWIFTVAATNMDRKFNTLVELGNGMKFEGISVNTFQPKKKMYPLISAEQADNGKGGIFQNASLCDETTLVESKVKGKIVLCPDDPAADAVVKQSNAAGTIMSVDVQHDTAFTTLVPASTVPVKSGKIIANYINTTRSPQAIIHKSVAVNATAPKVASFSSRGPQTIAKYILKPDISAPGIDILAGFTKLITISESDTTIDTRFDYFNIMSGTSMATPHVAAAAAYVKTFHPNWSPAAIKSALMTTAKPVDSTGPEDPLGTGSGLISPIDAVDPGLIYDVTANDYIRYLCKQHYNGTILNEIGDTNKKHRYNCTKYEPSHGVDGLNYPSMHLRLLPCNAHIRKVFQRTVTHVGDGPAVYKAKVTAPEGLSINVVPDVLAFLKPYESKTYNVVLKGSVNEDTPQVLTTFLEWNDSKHRVRSPILIYKPTVTY